MFHKSLKLQVLLIPILFSNIILAQTEVSKRFDLKLYYNFKYSFFKLDSSNSNSSYNTTDKNFMFGKLSPSILIYSKRSMHEFEISNFNFGYQDYQQSITYFGQQYYIESYKQNYFNLNLKYEYIFNLTGKGKKYGIMLGSSIEPYLKRNVYHPFISGYKTNQFILGAKLYIIPRGVISIGKKFYVDLNFPFELIDMYWNRIYINNPALSKDLKSTNNYESDFLNKFFQFRLGLGIKL